MPPFTRPTMFGLSPTSIKSSIGWNGAGSSIEFTLVQDVSNGDSPAFPSIGGASYFSLGSYSFNGLLTKYTQNRSKNGYPVWEARIQDPRHLLDQCKIILADYRLSISGFYNLFNVFGYWENTGYGNSQLNDSGMPWELVRDGILNICNAAYGSFGGPITYKGQTYSLDLSQLPALPSYFRIASKGAGLSISDFIAECCNAANYDFYIKLSSFQIQVKTVPRVNAYPFGTIGTMLSTTFSGSVLRSSDGLEERDEPTSVFLIGGDVHELVKVDPNNVFQFCGFDASGVIMMGGGGGPYTSFANFSVRDCSVPVFGTQLTPVNVYSYPVRQYTIYTPELSAITGQSYWFTDDLELEIALGLGAHRDTFGSWCNFLQKSNPNLYQIIALSNEPPNIQPPVGFLGNVLNAFGIPNNVTNTSPTRVSDIQLAGRGTLFTTGQWRLRLVYDVVAKFARESYGKKYAVKLPDVLRKIDTDTGVISNSHDICDGGWVDATDPNDLLSLPSYASDLFQTQDGRYVGFVKFDSINADLSRVNPSNSLISGNNLYVKSKVNNQIYFDGSNNAFAVIEVDPIYDYPDMVVGISGVIGPLYVATGINYGTSGLPYNTALAQRVLRDLVSNQAQGSIPLIIHPRPRFPTGYEIPVKSNVLTYGPWYAQGDTGRVTYEQDSSLVPWNYGSYANLNLAGAAKSAQGVSAIQVIETGYVEVAGYPAYNLGDVIQANGPNITNISIDFGEQGVTTTYRFETYVPRYGQLGKYNVDRFKKLNIASHKVLNDTKARNRLVSLAGVAQGEAQNTLNMLPEMFAAINIRSPNNVLVAKNIQAPSGERYPLVSTTTYAESIGLIPPDPSGYNATTIGTWEQFIHPYSLYHNATYMPRQDFPVGVFSDSSVPNSLTLQPWKDTNNGYTVKQYTKGSNSYIDMNDYFATGINPSSSGVPKRVFGLRGPVVINGWGYDIEGNIAPTGINYLTDASSWKTGPLDPLWDNNRKVWSVHDLMNGRTQEIIYPTTSGLVSIYKKGSGTPQSIYAYGWASSTMPSGSKVSLGYVATDNRWYILNNRTSDSDFCIAISDECTNVTQYLHSEYGVLSLNSVPCNDCGSIGSIGDIVCSDGVTNVCVSFPGIQNSHCTTCANYADTIILPLVGSVGGLCGYKLNLVPGDSPALCQSATYGIPTLVPDIGITFSANHVTSQTTLTIGTTGCTYLVLYQGTLSSYPMTLNRIIPSSNGPDAGCNFMLSYCQNWPDTITVTDCSGVGGSAPTVDINTSNICNDDTSLTITGTHYTSPASSNSVVLVDSLGIPVGCSVASGTSTSLVLTLTSPPISNTGALKANVTNANGNSGTNVQVGTVTVCSAAPTVEESFLALCASSTSATFNGTHFTSPASSNTVLLNGGTVACTINSGTSTMLIVNITTPPIPLGYLTAQVTNANGSSSSVIIANISSC